MIFYKKETEKNELVARPGACKVNKMSTEGLEEFVKAAAARGSDETVDKKVVCLALKYFYVPL